MLTAERADFSLLLVVITLVSGLVWTVDALLLRPRREAVFLAAGRDPAAFADPGTVDYARSFFPVAVVLLVLRSFLFEPYRIPSDSMMPTLLDGDFIVVNKYAYGLRLPVSNHKFLTVGAPERGDVVVFRYPPDPQVNYIKRVVGLPGDLVQVRGDRLIINGEPVPFRELGRYSDGCYLNMRLAAEKLGEHEHQVLHCLTPDGIVVPRLSSCDRDIPQGYICNEAFGDGVADSGDVVLQVPEGRYLMVGDNRDNSQDGRWWGFVDEKLLVGKATRIWFNWDLQRSGGPAWSRIGNRIQ
ncbi:MAG: signal peptidase I [Sinobacteraceae bacterium]|nr:signal peptidase I [Nevskiaceae bacterium]MCP5339660.1 signal peptidase I [Nevskiaceae bacterium]MCP5360687.1 signal peptidase I [Nevskiaceae bacterium]